MVGPLPVTSKTTVQPLNYIYNKGVGIQRIYDQDDIAIAEFGLSVGASVSDITQDLLNGVSDAKSRDLKFVLGQLTFY